MFRRKVFLGVLLWIGFGVNVAFAGPDMNPGKWELTIDMEMPGMPMKMPSQTVVQCLTDKEMVPDTQQGGQNCKINHVSTSGNTVTWTIDCDTPDGKTKGKGSITYNGDQMAGTVEIETGQEGMKIINKIKGRRIGDCD